MPEQRITGGNAMNKIIFPLSSGETGCHRLDPIVKEQLKAKPSTGGFYEDYSPAAEDIDIPGARASATYGIDISADVEVQSFNHNHSLIYTYGDRHKYWV